MWWKSINDMYGFEYPHYDAYAKDKNITWDDIRYLLTLKYGQPFSGGNDRMVFKTKTGVVKLEYPDSAGSNEKEYNMKAWLTDVPMPLMRLKTIAGYDLLYMEWVEDTEWVTGMPDWVSFIDCGQVGYTKSGRLVPFDII